MAEAGHSGARYVLTWLALVALTAASFIAEHLPLGAAHTPVALGIAMVKTVLVLTIFMHLMEEKFSTRVVAVLNFVFVLLLCLGIVADVAVR
jgi:cytochrome c oxidase subunit 4